jgi:chemotaxis signal transduction protein
VSERGDFLLVSVGHRRVGLRLVDVIEVADLGEVHAVPLSEPSLRGVSPAKGSLVPVVHLGALLASEPCPEARSTVGVLAVAGGALVCFEVDDADVVTGGTLRPVPPGEMMPWALAVVQVDDDLVPILNLNTLRDRLAEAGTRS